MYDPRAFDFVVEAAVEEALAAHVDDATHNNCCVPLMGLPHAVATHKRVFPWQTCSIANKAIHLPCLPRINSSISRSNKTISMFRIPPLRAGAFADFVAVAVLGVVGAWAHNEGSLFRASLNISH
jgi:hypothetical protein